MRTDRPRSMRGHACVALLVLAIAGMSASCVRRPAAVAAASPAIGMDSASGVIAIAGSAVDEQVILRAPDAARTLLPTSDADSAAFRRLSGVEVVVWGRPEGRSFVVVRYMATRVDGQPIVDGILRQADGRLTIETPAGTHSLGNPPAALRALAGARVWLGGSLATGPTTFGVIVPPR